MASKRQGPLVRRPISANPEFNFHLGSFFFCLNAFSEIIFSVLSRKSNYQIIFKRNDTEFAVLAFMSEIKIRANPGLS